MKKAVVAEATFAKSEVEVASVNNALVKVPSAEKKLCDEVALRVLNLVEEAVVEKREVPVALANETSAREESPETERVPVAEMFANERVPEIKPLPTTERAAKGEVVAIPRKPLE